MRAQLPPLASIRVFESAARHGNFTAAANELSMTQAAVSYQIKVLEERVGAPLFVRLARGVQLSEIGEQFAARASDALNILSDAFADAKQTTQETLAISTIPTFATNFLAQHLGKFQLENPAMAVRIEVSETIVHFASSPFDVSIRGGKGNWPGLKSHLLLKTQFTPMLSPDLAKTIGGIKEPADLLKLPILAQDDPWWRTWFKAAGLSEVDMPKQPGSHLGPQVLEANAAIAGRGVGILTPAFYKDAIEQQRLYQPFDLVCDDGTGYWLVYPESRRNAQKIKKFQNWLDKELVRFTR